VLLEAQLGVLVQVQVQVEQEQPQAQGAVEAQVLVSPQEVVVVAEVLALVVEGEEGEAEV
jgi:hypothetical protein